MRLIFYALNIDYQFTINGKDNSETISSSAISNPDTKVIAFIPRVETEVEFALSA